MSLIAHTLSILALIAVSVHAQDPCAAIAGKTWVAASDARACFKSLPFNITIRNNIVEVVNKTMAFHTSTNYEVQAPAPFVDVHEDIIGTLGRISQQTYQSDFDLHVDIASAMRRMGDGHSVYVNMCYDLTYTSFVPVPLVLLQNKDGSQNIYVDPQAYKIFSQDFFKGQLEIWQQALGNKITLDSLPGAKVIAIDDEDPWKAVDAAAAAAGSFQSFATRQNSFFAGLVTKNRAWNYLPGLFAQTALPLKDSVTLTVQRVNSSSTDTVTLPFRSQFHKDAVAFTDKSSFWKNNCLATATTNGSPRAKNEVSPAAARFSMQSFSNSTSPMIVNTIVDVNSAPSVPIPASLTPVRINYHDADDTFTWILDDNKTGLFAIGNFNSLYPSEISLMVGLSNVVNDLKYKNATRLIIDVSNNPGGLVCTAAYLRMYLMGNTSSTAPQAFFPTKFRAQPLAQKIVDNAISAKADKSQYYPTKWKDANNLPFPATTNYLKNGAETKTINGRPDVFSQTIGQECQPFYYFYPLPKDPIWKGEIVIVSNGRCASTCALFVTALAKYDKVKVISIGGKLGTPQQYAGTVGGQSLDFSVIDSEIKSAGLKNDTLAPPDFITNSYQGITWRLAQGAVDKNEPEEWQSRQADGNYQLTAAVVNDPWKMWNDMAAKFFKD